MFRKARASYIARTALRAAHNICYRHCWEGTKVARYENYADNTKNLVSLCSAALQIENAGKLWRLFKSDFLNRMIKWLKRPILS